jgi:HSP20 family molecular chaperone IbpA
LRRRAEAVYRRVAERAYELYEGRGRKEGRDLEDWFCAERDLLVQMPIELSEYDDSLIVEAGVPGFNETELEIDVEPRCLYISGKREQQAEGKTVEAFRAVDLPTEIDCDNVGLTLQGGSLYIVLPKSEEDV